MLDLLFVCPLRKKNNECCYKKFREHKNWNRIEAYSGLSEGNKTRLFEEHLWCLQDGDYKLFPSIEVKSLKGLLAAY